jgi:putative ABC transport system ATP-binding protein
MTIRIRQLAKIYRVGVETIHALRGIDLDIDDNEFVAVMGSSGSGKSTLMNILGCLDRPTSGTYELAGKRTDRMRSTELAKIRNEQIGFVFQSFELLPRQSALKNVELPLVYARGGWLGRRRRAKDALHRVGLSDRITHRPNQLSGGQKQRVAIARALINRPTILLADEPTGNLDSQTTAEIIDLFRELHAQGQTIILVTHEEDVAAVCHRIVRLRDGEIYSDQPRERDPVQMSRAAGVGEASRRTGSREAAGGNGDSGGGGA